MPRDMENLEIAVKVRFKVKKALYDRIVETAKEKGLPGTIEDTLKNFCKQWFDGWDKMLKEEDLKKESGGLVGLDGKPMGRG